jgi:hypothetical protein
LSLRPRFLPAHVPVAADLHVASLIDPRLFATHGIGDGLGVLDGALAELDLFGDDRAPRDLDLLLAQRNADCLVLADRLVCPMARGR